MGTKHYFHGEEHIFSLVEEADSFRLSIGSPTIETRHVEDFLDTTVEWLSSNPVKGLVIDFTGVKSACDDFVTHLFRYYGEIKSRGLYVRFVNVAPELAPYVGVSNITVVISSEMLPVPKPLVSAREILHDLTEDLSDRELRKKHGLSHKGLTSIFKKLLRKGLITEETLARRWGIRLSELPSVLEGARVRKVKVEAAEVLKDIAANMPDPDLMDKYKLSRRGLESMMKKLYAKRLISRETFAGRTKTRRKN